ncbi:MAG: acyltransferase family protein [Rhodopila sp.]
MSLPQYLGHIPFGNAFGFGHAGVDFFFVLSGFIISYAHAADIGRPERSGRYAWRRITRIYPLYWVVTAIEVMSPAPDAAARLAPGHVPRSLLLPETGSPIVGVVWTLWSEMLFYLVFTLPVLNRRFGVPLAAATLLLVSTGTLVPPHDA